MKEWSFADATSGIFTGARFSGPGRHLVANTPDACVAIEGVHDHMCRRVDIVSGEIVSYQPPAPPDDEWRTWAWDAIAERWREAPTTAAIARSVRAERDRRMAAADWITLRAMRTGRPIPAEWAAYLQALADVPAQPGFPTSITWPDPP